MYVKTMQVIHINGDPNFAQQYKGIVQASCDSFQDYLLASGLGFKCFTSNIRIQEIDKKLFINCPASIEMGQKTRCSICSLCSGSKRDVVINAHGSTAKYVAVGFNKSVLAL